MNKYVLKRVSSKNKYGTMSVGTVRYSNLTESDKLMLKDEFALDSLEGVQELDLGNMKSKIFLSHRMAFGKDFDFDGRKMFMADQVNKNGSYFEVTSDYVAANPDGWTDINEDILIVTDKVPGVVIGHPVADCPVVMMEDVKRGVTAVGHCSAELIDKRMPIMVYEALKSAYDSKDEDIMTYVSACAGNEWTYDKYPGWATDPEIWRDAIVEKDGLFHIDLRKAIAKQFGKTGLDTDNITFNKDNTITNDNYYSHSVATRLNNSSKFGRHFEGVFYQDTEVKGKGRR